MKPNSQEAEYARKISAEDAEIEIHRENIKAMKASAKDAGLNVRAISKAAKELRRTRSQMRCDSCRYWSSGERCQRATSGSYSRKTSAEAHCFQWEQKK